MKPQEQMLGGGIEEPPGEGMMGKMAWCIGWGRPRKAGRIPYSNDTGVLGGQFLHW